MQFHGLLLYQDKPTSFSSLMTCIFPECCSSIGEADNDTTKSQTEQIENLCLACVEINLQISPNKMEYTNRPNICRIKVTVMRLLHLV